MSVPSEQTQLLLVVVLLLLWLLTRTRQRRIAAPRRRLPLTHDELGRIIFEIARANDLDAFRHLYLTGQEARQLLGTRATEYLRLREKRWLEEEFLEIGVRVQGVCRYEGVRVGAAGDAWLRVAKEGVGSFELPVGTAVQVERIWRLRDPVGDWTAHRWVGAPPREG